MKLIVSASLFALVVAPHALHAAPSGAQAEALFSQAKALMAQGKYPEACAALDAAEKLDPTTTTLVNVADCREKNHQYATAWGEYLQAERELRGMADTSSVELRTLVKARAERLQARLSTLTINVPPTSRVPQLEIIRDNDHVDPGAWDRTLPIDGGTYKISARAPDHREWTTTVVVGDDSDAQVVDVPSLGASAQPTTPTPAPVHDAAERPVVTATASHPYRASLIVGAGALVLGAVAIGLEASGSSIYDDARRATVPADQQRLWDSANNRRYLAEGLGAAAVAGAGVAVYLYVRGHGEHADPRAVTVAPIVSTSLTGLVVSRGW